MIVWGMVGVPNVNRLSITGEEPMVMKKSVRERNKLWGKDVR